MNKIVILICSLILLYSCIDSPKAIYCETDFQIFFGNSERGTNASLEYVLNSDRNIFKIQKDSKIYITKISKDELKSSQFMLDKSDFKNLHENKPGNVYFIRVKSREYVNIIKWADQKILPENNLFYKLLTTI
jgi:hypothetical protein